MDGQCACVVCVFVYLWLLCCTYFSCSAAGVEPMWLSISAPSILCVCSSAVAVDVNVDVNVDYVLGVDRWPVARPWCTLGDR